MTVSQKEIFELTEYIELMVRNMQTVEYDSFRQVADRVNFSEAMVIVFLGKGGSVKMRDIADHLRMSMSNLTAIVDKLVEKGMVRRDRSKVDRRVVLVELLPEGKEISMVYQKCHMDLSKQILEALIETERSTFLQLTKKVAIAFTMMKNRVAEGKDQPLCATE